MAVSLYDFLPLIKPIIPNVSDIQAVYHLRRALIMFCEDTLLWLKEETGLDVVAGQREYALSPDAGTAVVTVVDAAIGDKRLVAMPEHVLLRSYDAWDAPEADTSSYYFLNQAKAFMLFPTPAEDQAGALTVHYAVKPQYASSDLSVDDYLLDDWGEYLASGAAASLQRQPGKPWTSPQDATGNYQLFRSGIVKARIKSSASFTTARPLVKRPIFTGRGV
ncbi:hypothetical protein [Desulfovibrio inopinatus]|uniref:phage adaptor protein n=1 Tax=Desulfovibrio inopinatus TaxID=102109 RepID=UPI00041CF475|nr:hypothetical protein [Desulfovibrio inopinatus]